ISLYGLLNGDPAACSPKLIGAEDLVVVVNHDGRQIGLCVDAVGGEQEVVMKSLGTMLGEVTGVSGATILGDGRVSLIIDVASAIDQMRSSEGIEEQQSKKELALAAA
ncbi:MAG TPA: chemotaxis protein CheW, partial [Fimbriimonas sp.]|nr:chemotaxis protein CheW [Fimbriimonas sp.]